jgi:hypothetical protein
LVKSTILVSTYSNVNENPVSGNLEGLDFTCNRRFIGIHVDERIDRFFGREMIITAIQVETALLTERW